MDKKRTKVNKICETKRFTNTVDGMLSNKEGEALFNLAYSCVANTAIVEIGSYKGKSTIWLAKGSQQGSQAKVYAIDPHTGSPEHKARTDSGSVWTFDVFKENIEKAGVKNIITPIVDSSEHASRDFNLPIGLIFIDGAHEYDMVKLDFDLWFPKVIDGGVIAFHDTTGWPGPKKLVEEQLLKSQNFTDIHFVGSLTWGRKSSKISYNQRIKNRLFIYIKPIYNIAFNVAFRLVRAIRGL